MALTHGTGRFTLADLAGCGDGVVIEDEVLIFHPERVWLGQGVYIGHRTTVKGDTRGKVRIETGAWIGQDSYLNGAGTIRIGARTGIGPRVMMLTSTHSETPFPTPIIDAPLEFAPVEVGAGCDVGIGAILLPGTVLGDGVQVGAGAVVNGSFPPGAVIAGTPARLMRMRDGA